MSTRVLVVGGSGFVGSAAVAALTARGADLRTHAAPRLPPVPAEAAAGAGAGSALSADLLQALDRAQVVVNAAGLADAGAASEEDLVAANAAMPYQLALAARERGIERFVHVSSAAVQGDRPVLDDSRETSPFSPYSRSKALGERLLLDLGWDAVVVYRPQGVHGAERQVSRAIARIAASPLASVAGRGDRPSPQALAVDVGDAIAHLALAEPPPPSLVVHPWSGLTTAELLQRLGGRRPRHLPAVACRGVVAALRAAGRRRPSLAANARRVEMLWFGQEVADSWLTAAGWRPAPLERWQDLGRDIRNRGRQATGERS